MWCRLQTTRNTGCQGVGKVGPKERCYKKDWPPGRGGVAFVGPREENRFCQNELELPKKRHCSPNPVLCHLDAGISVFLRQGVCDPN